MLLTENIRLTFEKQEIWNEMEKLFKLINYSLKEKEKCNHIFLVLMKKNMKTNHINCKKLLKKS